MNEHRTFQHRALSLLLPTSMHLQSESFIKKYQVAEDLYNLALKWKVLILTWPGGCRKEMEQGYHSLDSRESSAHSHTLHSSLRRGSCFCFCSLIKGYNHSKRNLNFLTRRKVRLRRREFAMAQVFGSVHVVLAACAG